MKGVEGIKPLGKFVIGTSSTGLFSFVSPLLLVYGSPFAIPYSFSPAFREIYLGVKCIVTRMSLNIPLNTSTGTNFCGLRIAGVDFPRLVTLPPLFIGQVLSPDLKSLNLTLEEIDKIAIIADRSGILNAGEQWQPFGIYAALEVLD